MAEDQNEYPLPTTIADQNKRESARHLPRFFRTDQNSKFLSGVLDPLIQPGKLTRINTYVGRKDIPNFTFEDNYETDISTARQYYQLEPGFVYQDLETNKPLWFADYMDYMNSLDYYGANTSNHAKLNTSETYAWDPKIDWDKFANFKEYYWLPTGPDPITVYGHQLAAASTFTIEKFSEDDTRLDYMFTPNGLTVNPRLTLFRGNTYTFNINALHKPFCIKSEAVTGSSYFYNLGVSKQEVEVGTVTFTVPYEAPDLLYYIDNNDPDSQGMIDIKDINENTYLDVEAEVLGKKTYTTTSGISFINGLKLDFIGNVSPEKYSKGLWYVEGVGTSIRLVSYNELEAALPDNASVDLPFDVDRFDKVPFDSASNFPEVKEYLIINRASRDRNLWSRNNRWFHIDVLNVTAKANNQVASPDQTARAVRPIIEFQTDIKLFNHGWLAKQDVDLVDTITTDVFSEIEGKLGYYVDGKALLPGHRVLFTADSDPLVVGKIYKVGTIVVDTTQIKLLSATCTTTFPYKVTFTFDTLVTPPPVNVGYYVEGNANINYKGLYTAISSTTSTITLLYPKNPGTFGNGITTGIYDNAGKRPQITLIPTEDSDPIEGETVYIKSGTNYSGNSFHFDGTKWALGQKKSEINQAPLFDLFDNNKVSYADPVVYPNNTFSGNRIFGYRVGTGTSDSELGFPLQYRSIDNIGDIEFEFDLESRSWTYVENGVLATKNSYQGYIRKRNINDTFSFYNGWTFTDKPLWQKATRVLQVTEYTDLIPIDIFDNSAQLIDLTLQVYVNDIKRNDISRSNINGIAFIKFDAPLNSGDKVVYKIQSVAPKNARGYYEIPHNLQNNPFNEPLKYFTLGETLDHVRTIVENNSAFSGNYPGVSNLPILGDISKYGRRFLQHSGSFPLASYLITDKKNNIIDALQWTSTQYTQFKKEFLRLASTTAFEGSVSSRVDQILLEFSKSKYIDRSAFYFSDMAPYKGFNQRDYRVDDPRLPTFVIDSIFNPRTQTTRSVLVYVNGEQLTYITDYTFNTTDAFVDISYPLNKGDIITIKDYLSTNGSYIPYTPSKLGIFPSYQPQIYLDDTLINPVNVIQGHDGSITVAYNDFRDDLLLELEKRIYNTRRISYDSSIFNLDTVTGGYYRENLLYGFFNRADVDNITLPDFLRWNSMIGVDYSTNDYFLEDSSFTYNYKNAFGPDGSTSIPGYWRGIYKYFYDTDRPHIAPWEMQGYTIKPSWWDTVYGVAPYTNENKLMWSAIEKGIINTPGNRRTDSRYIRPGLSNYIPVDGDGNLLSPLDSNLVKEFSLVNAKGSYLFGDHAPVESAWRRTSEYPFTVIKTACILKGSEYIAKMWDRFTIKRNLVGQIYNSATGRRFNTADIVYPNTPMGDINDPNTPRHMNSGLSNIIDDYVFSLNAISLDAYKEVVSGLQVKLSHRMGAFTAKDKINVLLDSRSPTASGTVFLPQDNYDIFFNLSSPISSVVYSGVLVEKLGSTYPVWLTNKRYFTGNKVLVNDVVFQCRRTHLSGDLFENDFSNSYWIENKINDIGFRISGYDKKYGTFKIFPPITSLGDSSFNVGGVSETYVDWKPNNYYTKDIIAKVDNKVYYRAIVANTSSTNFNDDLKKWSPISNLPITGGISAIQRRRFSDNVQSVPYGTVFTNVQSVVDFLLGYQEYLKFIGFSFDNFNKELGINLDWLTSAKEFMFWSLQNWDSGAIVTLSPSATFLKFNPTTISSVDDFSSSAFEYSILKADGTPFKLNLINIHRNGTGFTVKPSSDSDGIYFIRANLIHREHVLLLDNISNFNDTVYDTVSGYRQGRVKLLGFKTSDWDGGYTTPGFMYDAAIINPWQPFIDYNLGDIVSYKNVTYVAVNNVPGTTEFDFKYWKQQEKDVNPGLMANWDYRIEQFRDFYDLNASIFDGTQKRLARHLIGYQDRPYLNNIITDDVAQFKFYQGFIKEKGTYNSISKLFDVLRSSGFSTINLYEEWAFKVGDYGASDTYSEIEFVLEQSQVKHNPQDIVLSLNTVYGDTDPAVFEVVASDLTVKPATYIAEPFPTKKIDSTQSDYGIFKYQVAGYVAEEDVEHIIYNRAALLNYDISMLKNQDKIWLGYTENNDWDVLEYIKLDMTVTTWTVDFVTNSHIYLYCDTVLDLKRGDFISISNLGIINGSYIVQTVSDNIVTIYTLNTLATIPDLVTNGVVHKFISVRYKDLQSASAKVYNRFDIEGEKVWIDRDLNGDWLVLENINAFKKAEIIPYTNVVNQQNGYDIKISGNGLFMIVSAPFNDRGTVILYARPNNLSDWAYNQTLDLPKNYLDGTSNDGFGVSMDISYDGKLIAISAPYASELLSYFVGQFDENTEYTTNDIVVYNDNLYKATVIIDGNGAAFDIADWEPKDGYGANISGHNSGLSEQGAVVIYEFDSTYAFRYIVTEVLLSFDPKDNERFGSKVKLSTDGTDTLLFVAAKEYSYDRFTLAATERVENQNQIFVEDTSDVLIGQTVFGITDVLSGTPIIVKVVSVDDPNQITVDQYVSVDDNQILTFSLDSVGRVQIFRRAPNSLSWSYNTHRFLDFTHISGEFPDNTIGATSITSGTQYGYDISCTANAEIVAVSAPFLGSGVVYIFRKTIETFILFEVINSETLSNGDIQNTIGGYISSGDGFGYRVTLTQSLLLVSAPNNSLKGNHVGAVFNFQSVKNNGVISAYKLVQIITPPTNVIYERFGTNLSIDPSENILTISATGGPSVVDTTFDSYAEVFSYNDPEMKYVLDPNSIPTTPTTFDAGATKFHDETPATGSAYVYNVFDNNFIYGSRLSPFDELVTHDNFGFSLFTSSDCILVGTPNRSFAGRNYGTVFVFNYTTTSWNKLRSPTPMVDVNKFKKAFYYNTETNVLVSNLDLYDPAKGKIPAVAEQEIDYQTYYDPAVYEFRDDDGLVYNSSQIWTDNFVGKTWWDLSTFKYTWYEQGTTVYRNNNWGQLFPGSLINVYEWVESTYLPSAYAELADTTEGLAIGVSGMPKDTSDLTYSTKVKYDKISGTVTTLYYFWVSNRRLMPANSNRSLSAYSISALLLDPKSQGYSSVAVTSKNSLSLTNIITKLSGNNVSLNLQFYEIDNTDLQVHREYVLIPKGDKDAIIPSILEKKWFDSLIGQDVAGNLIPDNELSIKQRYGNLVSPQQSWFVNRLEALKQTFEYVNTMLQSYSIADEINLSNLEKKELPPSIISGDIDYIVDTFEELEYIGTAGIRPAKISLVIVDTQVYDWFIDDSGYGYGRNKVFYSNEYGEPVLWYGPTVKIVGTGTGAYIETYINSNGEIVNASIIRRGSGYDSIIGSAGSDIATVAVVREFTVLVSSDSEARGYWSLQAYQHDTRSWLRVKTQAHDVTRFWNFADWYAPGYGKSSDVKFVVENNSNLNGLPVNIGDLVKITNVGLGTWLLLLRTGNSNSPDFTDDYRVVGKQDATIQFSPALYNYNNDVGYDERYSFDLDLYDSTPSFELRVILEALRDDVLVGTLRFEYLNLFFNNIHYVLSEQLYTDWFFKTSFLKLNQVVGNLNQNLTFQSDPLSDYEAYIEEVKPYRTKIREFVSSYQGYDYSYNTVADFDLPSYYNPETGVIEAPQLTSDYITQYPWANWLENHTYEITDISITNKGSGYVSRPVVVITPPVPNSISWMKSIDIDIDSYVSFNGNYYLAIQSGTTSTTPPTHKKGSVFNGTVNLSYIGTKAEATAYIATGSVFKITVDNPGYGYTTSPIITIRGGNGFTNFEQARAYAIIGGNKTRSMTVKMKFDRYLREYYSNSFKYTNIYQADTQSIFKLTYAPEIEKSKFSILVNNIAYYGAQYTVSVTQELHDTYTALVGTVKLIAPVTGTVSITYYKNISMYGAADRINYAYNPRNGQPGKDLAQLMTGIDYGGVEFTSIGFEIAGGWDVLPWDISSWDTIVDSNDDYVFLFSNSTITQSGAEPSQFTLPYVPNDGDVINVYLKPFGSNKTYRIDELNYESEFTIHGNPVFLLENGPVSNTPSVSLNNLVYMVKVTDVPLYNNATNVTSIIVNIFTTSAATGSYQYPKPLTGWTFGAEPLVTDALRYDYTTWRLQVSGNKTSSFDIDTEYELESSADDYISLPHSIEYVFFIGDFTIELFVNPTVEPDAEYVSILSLGTINGKQLSIGHNMAGSGLGYIIPNDDNDTDILRTGFDSLALDTWSHIALTRKGNSIYFFVNGVLQDTVDNVGFTFNAQGPLYIGHGFEVDSGYFNGLVSNIRMIRGTALYTVNFAVPNIPLADIQFSDNGPWPSLSKTVLAMLNSETVTGSFVGDGVNNLVTVSTVGYLSPGDQLIFRKSTSDGTILPNDQLLLDSLVSGGDLSYTSAKGVAPEEIIVDGDKFVTSDTGHGPEELLQGHITDAVEIKVFNSPTSGGPRFVVNNYIGDGSIYTYKLGALPPNDASVTLTVNNKIITTRTIDYANKTVDILLEDGTPNPPNPGDKVTIMLIDTSGYDILTKETFIGDSVTTQFLTAARYSEGDVSLYITIDGDDVPSAYIRPSDNEYAPNVVVVIDQPPLVGSVIQVMIFRGTIQKYSKATNQIINVMDQISSYPIERSPKDTLPLSAYVWVIVTSTIHGETVQEFLRAPDYVNFTYPAGSGTTERQLPLDSVRYKPRSLNLSLIRVYKNNLLLRQIRDYNFDVVNNIITLTTGVATTGDQLIVEILSKNDFEIVDNMLVITTNYSLVNKDTIQLTVFTNHNMFDVKRLSDEFTFTSGFEANPYDIMQYDISGSAINSSGVLNLPRVISDESVLLVSISRRLLVPQIEYVLTDERDQVRVILPEILTKADYVEVITTNPLINRDSFGFKIFKDMLNRNQYKRISDEKTTTLAKDLRYYDTTIEVLDASVLDQPNRNRNLPGVINVNFERIEYMVKTGNVLSQLRRGTLGTAVNQLVLEGTNVVNSGYTETISYHDTENKNTYISDTAITENFGTVFGTNTSTVYGTRMVIPDHAITTTLSINKVDIPIELVDVYQEDAINTNRNNIKDAINLYTNITGVVADRVVDSNHPFRANNPNGIDIVPIQTNIELLSLKSKGRIGSTYLATFDIATQALSPRVNLPYDIVGSLNTAFNGTYTITDSTPSTVTLEYSEDPGSFTNIITILSFATKTGIGPYIVTFNIPTLAKPPSLGVEYTISGNLNAGYNGSFTAIRSTVDTISLSYPTDPGIYKTMVPITSFVSKEGTGPYYVTFNVVNQSFNVLASITAGTNKMTVSDVTGIGVGMQVLGVYGSAPGLADDGGGGDININDPTPATIISIRGNVLTLDLNSFETLVNAQTDIVDYLPMNTYYSISGVNDEPNPLIEKSASYFNGTFLAILRTESTVMFEYPTDPGIFGGGISINLSRVTKMSGVTTILKESPSIIKITNPYVLPIDFVPRVTPSTVVDGNTWYRDTIPDEYGQNDEMEVFVSGRRLNKNPIIVYDQTLGQDSYKGAGDKQIEADYSVNGTDQTIRFTHAPTPGAIITIVTRKGRKWYKAGETVPLSASGSEFAKFITSTSVSLPK